MSGRGELTAESEDLIREWHPDCEGISIVDGDDCEWRTRLRRIEAAAAREALAGEAIALLCDMGLGLDMGTSAPVSGALRDALAARYEETERNGIGKGMTVEDWRECIDAELDRAARASDGGRHAG